MGVRVIETWGSYNRRSKHEFFHACKHANPGCGSLLIFVKNFIGTLIKKIPTTRLMNVNISRHSSVDEYFSDARRSAPSAALQTAGGRDSW